MSKMIRKNIPVISHVLMFDREIIGTNGSKSVISTSKIKKITAMRKKRREKGMRAEPLGSNPHSKGEFFSRSLIVFLDRVDDTSIKILERMRVNRMNVDRERIIFPGSLSPIDWKSTVLYIY